MSKAIGIDLGTTFSAVAYLDDDGKSKIIRNRDGDNTTPSVVNFDENGEPLAGRLAKDMSIEHDADTVMFVKRYMGDPDWAFPVGDKEYNPEMISSIILKRLKEDAESFFGEDVTDAVITVPAYFGDDGRIATTQAGKIAGLNVLKIINEPTAAALAYGTDTNKNETILVYDLGGGTFDVTIMKIEDKDIKVQATGGDRNLGGFNWDNLLMEYLHKVIQDDYGVDFYEKEHGMNMLRKLAESAKIALSDKETTPVNIDLGAAGRKKIDVTREKFNELTESLTNNTIDMTSFVLEDARLSWKDIDKILLVGGSTKMPMIREAIEKATGKKPSRELNPDEVVAMGAAIQAEILRRDSGASDKSPKVLNCLPPAPKDVCSHSLGIKAVKSETGDGFNAVVMPHNTEIPGKVSEPFATVADRQSSLKVIVTEGEGEDLDYVKVIGEGIMKLDPHPKGSPLEVEFEYDANQIVHVHVYDIFNNARKHLGELQIKRDANMSEEKVSELTDLMRKTTVN
jgi:molecular chaperone DnaK